MTTVAPLDHERQLMIKTKICQRMLKEVAFYKEEVKENEGILAEMKLQSDKDQYDIKRFENVLGESYMMVPDSTKRLQTALDDLAEFIEQITGSSDEANKTSAISMGEWLVTAQLLLQENNSTSITEQGETGLTRVDDLVDGEAF